MFFQIEKLSYRHPGVETDSPSALQDISLNIEEGEWVALIGANGSGKTTLARHLNALLQPTTGRVLVNGLDTKDEKNFTKIRSDVGMVFQSPEDQIVASLVIEDTAFGLENIAIPTSQINERVKTALEAVGMYELRERPPHLLSAGQIQRVALAGVLAMQPRCVIFDETTSMLDPVGRRDVLAQMQTLHERGITIVMITHSMDEAFLAKRVILLNQGYLLADGSPEKVFRDEDLLESCHLELPSSQRIQNQLRKYFSLTLASGEELSAIFRKIPENHSEMESKINSNQKMIFSDHKVIEIEGLWHKYMPGTPLESVSLRDVSLTSYSGMAHGLVGATGSGKSTLLQHLNGLYLPQSGKVHVGSFHLEENNADIRALRRFAGIVFQNPESAFFEQYVGDEIAFGPKLLFGREGLRERVKNAMTQVGLDFEEFKDRMTTTLSGGEKRKVALACALAMNPGLLILDEPTAGLDPFSRNNLLRNLTHLQKEGLEIVLSSHNMEDVAELARQVTVLDHGSSVAAGDVGEIFNNFEMMEKTSLIPPVGISYRKALRAKGWQIPTDAITLNQIENVLAIQTKGGKL